jgi:hypothetical protein
LRQLYDDLQGLADKAGVKLREIWQQDLNGTDTGARSMAEARIARATSLRISARFATRELTGDASAIVQNLPRERISSLRIGLGDAVSSYQVDVWATPDLPTKISIRSDDEDWYREARETVAENIKRTERYWLNLYRGAIGPAAILLSATIIGLLAGGLTARAGVAPNHSAIVGIMLAVGVLMATMISMARLWPRLELVEDPSQAQGYRVTRWMLGTLGALLVGAIINLVI